MELLFLLSVLFWKPIYFLYLYFYRKDQTGWLSFTEYFKSLWALVSPMFLLKN